jgi:hypothetical protein
MILQSEHTSALIISDYRGFTVSVQKSYLLEAIWLSTKSFIIRVNTEKSEWTHLEESLRFVITKSDVIGAYLSYNIFAIKILLELCHQIRKYQGRGHL